MLLQMLLGMASIWKHPVRDGYALAAVESDERSVYHVVHVHHDVWWQRRDVRAGLFPDGRPGRTRQHHLHANALACDFLLQPQAQLEQMAFGAAVTAVEPVWRECPAELMLMRVPWPRATNPGIAASAGGALLQTAFPCACNRDYMGND
jgi:hypothetical protein